jgi:anti-sigma B factor antagonist
MVDNLSSVETTVSGPCLVAKVRGVMDYSTQPELRTRLQKVIAPDQRAVVLDVAEVTFCDSVGLNILLEARLEAQRAGIALALVCVPGGMVHRVLEITGATRVLQIFDTVTAAEAALAG